jgi:hypothetical protein
VVERVILLALLLFMVMAAKHSAVVALVADMMVMVAVTEVMAVLIVALASTVAAAVLAAILAKVAMAEIQTRLIMDFRVTVTAVRAAVAALEATAEAEAALVFLEKGARARAVRLVRLVSPAAAVVVALEVMLGVGLAAVFTAAAVGARLELGEAALSVSSGPVHHACSHRLGQGTYKWNTQTSNSTYKSVTGNHLSIRSLRTTSVRRSPMWIPRTYQTRLLSSFA